MKIAITTSSFAAFDIEPLEVLEQNQIEYRLNPYGRKLSEDEIITLAHDVDGLIAGTEKLSRKVLELLPKLKVISRCGAGLDNVDLEKAAAMQIKVYNTPYGPTLAVAELAVGMMFNLLRKIKIMDHELCSGTWKKRMGNLLAGKKIGIIGFGRIGQKVAELLKPFNTEISYYDTQIIEGTIPGKALDEMFEWADIITMHCSGSADGKALIGRSELEKIKHGAFLLNFSRGGLVDENALFSALEEGQLSGAAFDVFKDEPYSGPLRKLDNIILTPHIGSYAKEGRIQMEMDAVQNLVDGLK